MVPAGLDQVTGMALVQLLGVTNNLPIFMYKLLCSSEITYVPV